MSLLGGSSSDSRTENINDQDQSNILSRDIGGAIVAVDAGAMSGKRSSLQVTDARDLSDSRSFEYTDSSNDESITGSFNQDNRKLTAIEGSFNTDNRSYSDSRSFSSIERTTTHNNDNRSFVYNDLSIDAVERSLSTVDLATVAQHETLRGMSDQLFQSLETVSGNAKGTTDRIIESLETVSGDAKGTTDRIVQMAETFKDGTASQLSMFRWLLIPVVMVMGVMAWRGGRAR